MVWGKKILCSTAIILSDADMHPVGTDVGMYGSFYKFSPEGRHSVSHVAGPTRGFGACQPLRTPFGLAPLYSSETVEPHMPALHKKNILCGIVYPETSIVFFFKRGCNFKSHYKRFPQSLTFD